MKLGVPGPLGIKVLSCEMWAERRAVRSLFFGLVTMLPLERHDRGGVHVAAEVVCVCVALQQPPVDVASMTGSSSHCNAIGSGGGQKTNSAAAWRRNR